MTLYGSKLYREQILNEGVHVEIDGKQMLVVSVSSNVTNRQRFFRDISF